MKVTIRITDNFKTEVKPLIKKYHSLKNDLAKLEKLLFEDPKFGTPLGNNAFKIRLKMQVKGKEKAVAHAL